MYTYTFLYTYIYDNLVVRYLNLYIVKEREMQVALPRALPFQ